MTELDFDELDKAVNSLMADVDTTKRNTSLDDPEDTVVSLDTTPPAEEEPVAAPGSQEPDVAAFATRAQPMTPLAVKRRGQFMDVIHPSSDMKSTPTSVRREGFNLQPSPRVKPFDNMPSSAGDLGNSKQQPDTLPASSSDAASPQTEQVGGITPASDGAPLVKNEWPDPIDMALSKEETAPNETADGASRQPSTPDDMQSGQELPRDVLDEVSLPELQEPITSPFITDAKVVKRPLGGIALETASEGAPQVNDQPAETLEASPTSTPAPEAPLPEELKGDVLSLESTSTNAVAETPVAVVSEAAATSVASRPTSGNGSIAQQYTEQPSTGDQSNTAIYDTSTHHQPLEQAAKKSSPLKWVIFVLVLLIIGAIAGAAYFHFTTNR